MSNSRQALTRVIAILAVLAAVIALTAVIGGSLGEEGQERRDRASESRQDRGDEKARPGRDRERAIYVVQSGDTLTAIATRTGTSVAELQALNPGVDPQILLSGQRLKLR